MLHGFRRSLFRIIRVAVLVLALIAGAVWLRGTFNSVESEQAVINAEIMQVRTPINGDLEVAALSPGMVLHKGDLLFKLRNPRFGDRESVSQYNALQNVVETLQGDVLGAHQSVSLAEIARDRSRRLYKAQLIARVEMEENETRYLNAQKILAAKQEQLDRSCVRAKEMAQQMAMQKESIVTMPVDGLIWSVIGKSGEQIEANKTVLELINPAHIWVDAFFSERSAPNLKPGLTAVIRSLDSKATWQGYLQSVRAGVGRMAFEASVAVPPPELAKRQIAVRVEGPWQQPFDAVEFFGVGRSVRVTFPKDAAQRTVADALREKWDRLLADSKIMASNTSFR